MKETKEFASNLRSDLIRLVDARTPRRWTLIDAISGKIWRLASHDLTRLDSGSAGASDANDTALSSQAAATGLLRRRTTTRVSMWSLPLRLLAFRIPIRSIDPVAAKLAPYVGFLFSPIAILVWTALAMLAATSVLIGWSAAEQSMMAKYARGGSISSLGYSLGLLFILTKCLHELGHAVACRRLGVPVGDVGLFFFCGMPCPYCDVSQVWRLDSRLARAAVMLAGIYVEVVLATIATLVWWTTPDGPAHDFALNTMTLCGISTIVFNANPLMRLDGYYVLSDCLGSPNLKRQAMLTWQYFVTNRLTGVPGKRPCWTLFAMGLSVYHIASKTYQTMISFVILMFVASLLREWNLWWLGVTMISAFICMYVYRFIKRWIGIALGWGQWIESTLIRRMTFSTLMLVVVAGILCIPLRREIHTRGVLDVADTVDVYIPESAWVAQVDHDFGDRVESGEPLVSLRDDNLALQLVGWRSKVRLANLESENLKREALKKDTPGDVAWKIDKANRELVETQFASLTDRNRRLHLTAPCQGTLLPLLKASARLSLHVPLADREGQFLEERTPWCRIGDPEKTWFLLQVDAKQRQLIKIGDEVLVCCDIGTIDKHLLRVDSISEMPLDERDVNSRDVNSREANAEPIYVLKCRLPEGAFADSAYVPIGAIVEGRVCIDYESLWRRMKRLASEALRG